MSANLLRNLAQEGALGGDTNFRSTGTPARAGGPGSTKARHQLGDATCPRTPAELASRLRSSLGDGQVNRLASLYDWTGKSEREARPILARLERMKEVKVAKQHLHGDFLWFRRDGVGYVVQDPALLARVDKAWAPSRPISAKMEALSAQMKPYSERMRPASIAPRPFATRTRGTPLLTSSRDRRAI